MIDDRFIEPLMVTPGKDAKLSKRKTGWAYADDLKEFHKEVVKSRAEALLAANREELSREQDVFYANPQYAILLILQAMDAGGKDGTIKHVMSGINPQGCQVYSFKQPTSLEREHDFLWRYMVKLPPRGMIGIFNRSYYEDVLVVRVHPELLGDRFPGKPKDQKRFWESRFEAINAMEHNLTSERTIIIKCFLHISRDEQRKRLLSRLDDPSKQWKFSASDLAERSRWGDYMAAFEAALTATSTDSAPWWVVPADHKWVARTVVADLLARAIRKLDLKYPEVPASHQQSLAEARKSLESE
jgi:PPK2 family polyphosphate:nucleotide phosphotransferase